MAGGKETPRQKMIGMMYLVLTALLALNISKDILNAFIQIDKGLGKTNLVLSSKAEATLLGLKGVPDSEKVKAAPFLAKAEEVNKLGSDMIDHLEIMKARIMACSMHGDKEGARWEEYYDATTKKAIDLSTPAGKEKVSKLDENQNNTTLLVGSNPQAPKTDPWSANELKTKLLAYRDALKQIQVTNVDGLSVTLDADIVSALDSAFTFHKEPDAEGHDEEWETNHFYHSPLAAVIATVSKIETDVMNAKTSVMSFLASSINATDVKFSNLTYAAVPLQSYVLKGDEFEAEIFLAAYNKESTTKIYPGGEYTGERPTETTMGSGASGEGILSNAEGKCIFKVNTGNLSLGSHGFKGQISFQKNGKEEFINYFIPPMTVGAPALVVSPVNMNVFYRGLDNPVEVSVPGVDPSALKVSMDGGSISGPGADGTYNVKPSEAKEALIKVSATINGKETAMPPKKFRIKKIPDPTPSFGGKKPYDSTIPQGDATVAAGVRADMEGFDFPVTATVTKFIVSMVSNGQYKEYACSTNKISDEASAAIKKMKKGEKVFIEQIMCKMPDNTERKLAPITLKLL